MVDQQEANQLRMAAVFQSVREGIMIFDEEMKLLEINGAAAAMLNCDVDLIGLRPAELGRHCPLLTIAAGDDRAALRRGALSP